MQISVLQVIYGLNVLVAGFVGFTALFWPVFSAKVVFQDTIPVNWAQRIVGCLWTAIALLSVLGLFAPLKYSPVLFLQLLYKGSWLVFIAVPKLQQGEIQELPMGMTAFFVIWVVALLICLPYAYLLHP